MSRMAIVSVMRFLCRIYGLPGSSRGTGANILRVIVLLIDVSVLAGLGIFFSLIVPEQIPERQLGYFTIFSYVPYHSALYLWRLRAGRLRSTLSRNPGPIFRLISSLLMATHLLEFVLDIAADIRDTERRIGGSTGSPYLDWYVKQVKRLFPLVKLQGLVCYLDIAIVLQALAGEVEHSSETLRSDSAVRECRRIETRCTQLSETLKGPLILMHVFYFIRLVSEVPLAMSLMVCNEDFLLFTVYSIRYLAEYLVIVSPANSIVENCRVLKQKIRCRRIFFEASINELRFFTMSDHGIQLLFGATLDWKFCCYFLSLSWGLTLTLLQSYFASIKVDRKCDL